jgi:phosphoribosylanthranilate isomerase
LGGGDGDVVCLEASRVVPDPGACERDAGNASAALSRPPRPVCDKRRELKRMFRVKICGVTSVEDAVCAVEAGADAIGLNFYEKSPRFVGHARSRDIGVSVQNQARCVGVFVNESVQIAGLCDWAHLDAVQLHGNETAHDVLRIIESFDAKPYVADFLNFLHKWNPKLEESIEHKKLRFEEELRTAWESRVTLLIIRARRMGRGGLESVREDYEDCVTVGAPIGAMLIDSASPGSYGGTGKSFDWADLVGYQSWLGETPLILAGGLTPDNVAEAIRIVRPAAVDVASGVESAPGKKDPAKVRDFVANALGAFEALGS